MTARPGIVATDPAKLDQMPPVGDLPEEMVRRATATIERILPAGPDRQRVLDALFGEPRKARKPHGAASYATPARTAWLNRCRAWVAEQGRQLAGTQIPRDLQRAYEQETGDVWTETPQ